MPLEHGRDEVSIEIEGVEFRYWSDLEITLSIDTFSTCQFAAPFEPDSAEFRERFRPFTFKPMQVLLGGEPLFTGTMVGIEPQEDENGASVTVTGYALPGVLGDCHAPPETVPLEFKGLDFRAILEAVVNPFGLQTDVRAEVGAAFEKAAFDVDQKPLEFLIELAKQRNVVLSNTPEGAVLCWQSVATGSPVARLSSRPLRKVGASFSSQEYFSEVTGFTPPKKRKGKNGSKFTERNPWLSNVIRPMSFKLDGVEAADAPTAVRATLGRMFANMAAFTLEDIATWRDPQGALWAPNTTVTLERPAVMIYRETEFLIRDVVLSDNHEKRSAQLNLVLPGAFSGKVPAHLPWDQGPGLDPVGAPNVEDEVLGPL